MKLFDRLIDHIVDRVMARAQHKLCRKNINKTLAWPHPMSASLDHVIPIARGGEHSYANTQIAHLTCNIRKRDKTVEPQQLALIG